MSNLRQPLFFSATKHRFRAVIGWGWDTSPRRGAPDVELQPYIPPAGSSVAIQALFGLQENELRAFPSIEAYCQHVEQESRRLMTPAYESLWSSLSTKVPQEPTGCWTLLKEVMLSLAGAATETSIVDLRNQLFPPLQHLRANEDGRGLAALFAAICWLTMTLQPSLEFEPPDNPPALACAFQNTANDVTQQRQHIREATRPIPRVVSLFKENVWDDLMPYEPTTANGEHDSLYERSLTFYALQFSRVNIRWVDTLGEHLKFDSVSRRLSIFRFPTFCVLSELRKQTCPVFQLIRANFHPDWVKNKDTHHVTLEQEILLSYRLIFGQSLRSRNLARSLLKGMQKDGKPFDDLLVTLCGNKDRVDMLPHEVWPMSCRDIEGQSLLESDVYSVQTDFPRLGYRLAQLQRFSLRHTPTRFSDLWKDRRNPLQWYTFWAVIWVGGAATVLATVQLALQAAQLAQSRR